MLEYYIVLVLQVDVLVRSPVVFGTFDYARGWQDSVIDSIENNFVGFLSDINHRGFRLARLVKRSVITLLLLFK